MTDTTVRDYDHLIEGKPYVVEERIRRLAPATGAEIATVGAGAPADVDLAVAAARRAFDEGPWPRMTGAERARVLLTVADLIERDRDLLAALDAEEGGKPLRLAEGDIDGAVALTRYVAGLATQMHGTTYTNNGPDFTGLVLREPAGVAALITPWNFPALILSQKLPFALAAGCTVVVKPSEFTTGSTLAIARLYLEAGLPPAALGVVTGDGRAGGALAAHPQVDVVSFTGSTATGRRIIDASKSTIKKLSLELGGKAANIVFADADLASAAQGVVFGAFFNNGECCVSQSRLLVEEAVAAEFLAEVKAQAERLRVGDPLDRGTDVGAMIHQSHLDAVLGHIGAGVEQGATVLTGGHRPEAADLAAGAFVVPTVLAGVTERMTPFHDEIFGPVLTTSTFTDAAEAIRLANAVDYGLANSVWSGSIDTALTVSKALQSGSVYVNTTIDAPPQMPFGGYKQSGIGREMGQAGFEEFTELKSVNIRTGSRIGAFAFPYDGEGTR
jgi:acyl-CoA reductase-like NAD-dependent aldehyde dehydrogenase